ncbi:MAG: DUF3667 domain-containing protein [Allosphingosinicella sp.]
MVTGIEGVGEAVTGGMLARAVEPEAGEAIHAHAGKCLNCSAALTGPYCNQCGQRGHVHRSLGAIGHDLVHGILHLDGKFWRTLPLLAWRPGELTRRYAHGERAKFVSPMAMFLFSVFTMFAVLSIYGLSLSNLEGVPTGAVRQGLETARTEAVRHVDEAQARRAALARGETVRREDGRILTAAELDRQVGHAREEVAAIDRVRTGTALPSGARSTTGWKRLDKGIEKATANPALALYKLQTNGYKFSWLLIPVSVPFVWLLFFWTRRFHFYDHTVFVTYSLSFMTMLATLLMILGFAGAPRAVIATAAVFVPPIHMFRQLKQAYRLHWASALLRTFLLLNFCSITAGLFFVILLGLGALG